MFCRLKEEKGQALVLTVMIVMVVALLCTGLITVSTRQKNISNTEVKQERAYFIANAGLTRALTVLDRADEPGTGVEVLNIFDSSKPEYAIWGKETGMAGDYGGGEIVSVAPVNAEKKDYDYDGDGTNDYRKWIFTIKSVGKYPKGGIFYSTKTLEGKVHVYEDLIKGGGWIASLPPAMPTGLYAAPGNRQVALTWDANLDKGLAGYTICRSLSVDGNYEQVQKVGKVTSWIDTGLTNGTTYYYKIKAYNVVNLESVLSLPAWATPFDPAPQTPTGLAAAAGDKQVSLKWNANSEDDLAGYKIYRSTDNQNYELIQTVGLVTSWTNTNLTNGTTYYYKITAYDTENNESEKSAAVSATPVISVANLLGGVNFLPKNPENHSIGGNVTIKGEGENKGIIMVNDNLTVQGSANCIADAYASGSISGKQKITGTCYENYPVPIPTLPETSWFESRAVQTFNGNKTVTLTYDAGTGKTTMTVSGGGDSFEPQENGIYLFKGDNIEIEIEGSYGLPFTIAVTGSIKIGEANTDLLCKNRPEGLLNLVALNLQPNPHGVKLLGNTKVDAVIIANGEIDLTGSSELYGGITSLGDNVGSHLAGTQEITCCSSEIARKSVPDDLLNYLAGLP